MAPFGEQRAIACLLKNEPASYSLRRGLSPARNGLRFSSWLRACGGRDLDGRGGKALTDPNQTSNAVRSSKK